MKVLLVIATSLVLCVSVECAPEDEATIDLINRLGEELRQGALKRLSLGVGACMSRAADVRQRSCVVSRGLEGLQAVNTAVFAGEEALRREAADGLLVTADLEAEVRQRLQAEADIVTEEKLVDIHKCLT